MLHVNKFYVINSLNIPREILRNYFNCKKNKGHMTSQFQITKIL